MKCIAIYNCYRHAFKATLCRRDSPTSHTFTRSYTWRSTVTRTTVLDDANTVPDNSESGSRRQPSIQMELMTGRDKAADDCLCCTGVDSCLIHGPNSVCFLIKEESEPASGSVHSFGQNQIEKTVKCDMIIKYRQKVKVIRREIIKNEVCSEGNDVAEIFQDERDVTHVDQMFPKVIVKNDEGDTATVSVVKSETISHIKGMTAFSDFSVQNTVLVD